MLFFLCHRTKLADLQGSTTQFPPTSDCEQQNILQIYHLIPIFILSIEKLLKTILHEVPFSIIILEHI